MAVRAGADLAVEEAQPRECAAIDLACGENDFLQAMNRLWNLVVLGVMLVVPATASAGPQPSYVNRGNTSFATRFGNSGLRFDWLPGRVLPTPTVDPIFINPGQVNFTNPPQINATAFLNLGTFGVQTILPFDFQNTLYYTNRGTVVGAPGFRFDYTDDFGVRRPAANFVNEASGQILTLDANGYFGVSNQFFQTMLQIRATNVLSQGYLQVGNEGTLRIEGHNVNLSRGGLEVLALESSPISNVYFDDTGDGIPDTFLPDNAIYDLYWGAGIQQVPNPGPINTANTLRFVGGDLLASSGGHVVQFPPAWNNATVAFSTLVPQEYFTAFANTGVVASAFLTLTNADGSTTNIIVPTNIFRQAVVVGVQDTNFTVQTRFGPPGPAGLGFGLVAVEIASRTTNVVQGVQETSALYFVDYLGYDTNTLVVTNLAPWYPTGRPFAYEIYRQLPSFNFLGSFGNTPLFPGFLYNTNFSNVFATNMYAGYRAAIDNLQNRAPRVPGVSPTNTPGRIEIQADTLDLSRTRIRGISMVEIKAAHLKTSEGAVVDVENLVYDLSSTNGLLTVRNLSKESFHGVRGELRAWTGIWSNQFALVLSNWFIDPNTNYFNPVTNAVDVNLYCLILSADLLTRTQQVITHTLSLSGTNVVVDDPYLVSTKMLINAEGLTVNNRLALTNAIPDWNFSMTPRLRFLTNNGTLRPWNVGYYGADFPAGRRLERFVNTGRLEAQAHEIACDQYVDSGVVTNANDLRLFAGEAILQGSTHNLGGSANYHGANYKLRNHRLTAGRSLVVNVTNSFTDAGPGSDNLLEVSDGFHLMRKPQTGDLFGTRIITRAPRFVSVAHTWAGEDRGPRAAGFTNNLVIGRLLLDSQAYGELRLGPPTDGLGTPLPGNYALYVDYLELSTNRYAGGLLSVAEDPAAYLVIERGLTVYFAMSNVDPEQLNGSFGGQLVWVKDFAGPNSGVDVALRDGRTLRVNEGLLYSQRIDSDGDGVVNALDLYPFDDLLITSFRLVTEQPPTVELTWRAAAQTTYQVWYTTNLLTPNWQVVATASNNYTRPQFLTNTHALPSGNLPVRDAQRYYRVSYVP